MEDSRGRSYPTVPRLQIYRKVGGGGFSSKSRSVKDSSPIPLDPGAKPRQQYLDGGDEIQRGGSSGDETPRLGGTMRSSYSTHQPTRTTTSTVAPHVNDLPDVVQRVIKGSSKTLSSHEMRILSKLTTEQRCAALGMECEGYSHDVILSYLIPASKKAKPEAKRPAYQPARSRSAQGGHRNTSPVSSVYSASRGQSPSSTPRTGGTPRRTLSPYQKTAVHQQVAQEHRFQRQNSDTNRTQEREKLKTRTQYDARKECRTPRGRSPGPTGTPRATSSDSRTPYWQRAGPAPTTPRRNDGSRVPAPKAFGDSAHRSSYLKPDVQMSSSRTRMDARSLASSGLTAQSGAAKVLLNNQPFSRSRSYMPPPPTLKRTKSTVSNNATDQKDAKKHHRDPQEVISNTGGDLVPEISVTQSVDEDPNESAILEEEDSADMGNATISESPAQLDCTVTPEKARGEMKNGNGSSSKAHSSVPVTPPEEEMKPVTRGTDNSSPLDDLSPRRINRWMDDFHLRLASLRMTVQQWVSMSNEQRANLFQQWRIPELQRRVISTRYP